LSRTTYRLLTRQGWSKPGARVKPTSSPESLRIHEETVPVRQRRKQPSLKRPTLQNRSSRGYPSDLTGQEWAILEPLIPPAKAGGHPRTTDMREVLNALFYVDRTGCQWRALPHDFPPWSTVWSYFRTWPSDRHLEAHTYGLARKDAREYGTRTHAQRGDH
jgi:transposase